MAASARRGRLAGVNIVTKDTTVCVSFASNPSNHGVRFHNYLYAKLGLDFLYVARAPRDIVGAVAAVRALPLRGASVSMPFKEAVIPLLDELSGSASAIESVNTIVNDEGHLTGHNTDYVAAAELVAPLERVPVVLAGSGGMAKAVGAALRDAGFTEGEIVARNEVAGRALADRLGWTWRREAAAREGALVVNVTPVGMVGAAAPDDMAFPEAVVREAGVVFDVVAKPVETPMIRFARRLDKPLITGGQVIALQAAEQFRLYTGVSIGDDLVVEAENYAAAT